MKTRTRTIILILSIFIAINVYSQDIIINFEATGEGSEIDYVKVENITKNIQTTTTEDFINLSTTTEIADFEINNNSMKIYPNPFMDKANIEFYSKEKQKINISIFDITGKIIININENIEQGTQNYSFKAGKYGIYFISISGNNFKINEKLISIELFSGNTRFTTLATKPETKQTKNLFYETGDQLIFTAYSSEISSIISSSPTESDNYIFEFAECKDYDQNNYPTVKIGNQIWMAENLKSEHYVNGNTINNCHYYNDNISNKNIYGNLYTWDAAMNGATGNDNNPSGVQGVCPTGWHVPSDSEWTELRDQLGGWEVINGKVKETGTEHWESPNSDATNESGLTILPAGLRWGDDGSYQDLGERANFWSTTDSDDPDFLYYAGGYRFLSGPPSGYYDLQAFDPKNHGKSIRCIKN